MITFMLHHARMKSINAAIHRCTRTRRDRYSADAGAILHAAIPAPTGPSQPVVPFAIGGSRGQVTSVNGISGRIGVTRGLRPVPPKSRLRRSRQSAARLYLPLAACMVATRSSISEPFPTAEHGLLAQPVAVTRSKRVAHPQNFAHCHAVVRSVCELRLVMRPSRDGRQSPATRPIAKVKRRVNVGARSRAYYRRSRPPNSTGGAQVGVAQRQLSRQRGLRHACRHAHQCGAPSRCMRAISRSCFQARACVVDRRHHRQIDCHRAPGSGQHLITQLIAVGRVKSTW